MSHKKQLDRPIIINILDFNYGDTSGIINCKRASERASEAHASCLINWIFCVCDSDRQTEMLKKKV